LAKTDHPVNERIPSAADPGYSGPVSSEPVRKILVVDDEPDIRDFLSYNLRREHFEVHTASDGVEGLQMALHLRPDIVLLDVMMPGMDGVEVCAELRRHPEMHSVLIVFLTARGEDYSQIAAFQVGADDYITKPVRPRVLVSRLQALLRRSNRSRQEQVSDPKAPDDPSASVFEPSPDHNSEDAVPEPILSGSVPGLEIDVDAFVVRRSGQEIYLTRKEFRLLVLLVSRPNVVLRREQILRSIWGDDPLMSDRTIDVHIRKIREKTGLENIRTIKGVGYKWSC
jgi:two-component system alkaline phosphatase synthesis response regulator PhoP